MNPKNSVRSQRSRSILTLVLAVAAMATGVGADAQEAEDRPRVTAVDTGTFVPAMQEISPGVFQIGKIRLDKTKRTVTFPGKLNMAKDLIEYVLVTPEGC
jgi:hypothetical protein